MELPLILLPVLDVSICIPFSRLPEMRLPAPATVPPIVFPLALKMSIPLLLPRASRPVTVVPM